VGKRGTYLYKKGTILHQKRDNQVIRCF